MLRAAILAALVCAAAPAAATAEVSVQFQGGYVTLRAREVTLRQILEEWSRVGNTRLVNLNVAPAEPLTLELTRVPEKQAIQVLLRSAAGYVAAPRQGNGGPSRFAQIRLMPPSAAPPAPLQRPGRRPVLRRPPMLQPQVPQMLIDDQGNPVPAPNPAMEDEQTDPAIAGPMDEDMPSSEEPVSPQPLPFPGVQPYPPQQPTTPPAGDPPPPDPGEAGDPPVDEQPEVVEPGPAPGQGAVVAPAPGQLPAPQTRDRRPRR
jgi:hypothetical protein